jgi:hypothetical protein
LNVSRDRAVVLSLSWVSAVTHELSPVLTHFL